MPPQKIDKTAWDTCRRDQNAEKYVFPKVWNKMRKVSQNIKSEFL